MMDQAVWDAVSKAFIDIDARVKGQFTLTYRETTSTEGQDSKTYEYSLSSWDQTESRKRPDTQ